jgi:hypothetical protein
MDSGLTTFSAVKVTKSSHPFLRFFAVLGHAVGPG